jgi:hypothetical protein
MTEDFTDGDWEEIFYALARKATEIETGALDDLPGEVNRPLSETAQWVAHLRAIMAKIASRAKSRRFLT